MATWIDYKELKQHIRMDQVLAQYGVLENLKQKGDNLVGPCPIHKGTNATQFHVSLAKNNFNCFGDCHGGGNVIDFVAKMEGLALRQAALKLQDRGIALKCVSKHELSEIVFIPARLKAFVANPHFRRGFLAQKIESNVA